MKQPKNHNNQNKLRNKFLNAGVRMIGPETVFFSNDIVKVWIYGKKI